MRGRVRVNFEVAMRGRKEVVASPSKILEEQKEVVRGCCDKKFLEEVLGRVPGPRQGERAGRWSRKVAEVVGEVVRGPGRGCKRRLWSLLTGREDAAKRGLCPWHLRASSSNLRGVVKLFCQETWQAASPSGHLAVGTGLSISSLLPLRSPEDPTCRGCSLLKACARPACAAAAACMSCLPMKARIQFLSN